MAPHALLTADVGPPGRYHVGDQAIMTANLEWVRRLLPPRQIRIFARDPEFSAPLHGVGAIRPPGNGFASRQLDAHGGRAGRGLGALLSRSGRALRSVGRASLLHICGGGNLTSLFRHELRTRSLYALVALEAGVPVIVTGQTLGPDLETEDRRLLARWLPHVAHLGVRDRHSAELAAELGADPAAITTAVDDAYFLAARKTAIADLEARIEDRRRPLVGLSLHHRKSSELVEERLAAGLAEALDALAERHDVAFLFLSHLHSVAEPPKHWDLRFGEQVRGRMRHGERVELLDAPLLDREVKHLSAACDFFVSTRYHGAVFALSGGVPTVSLTQDEHTRVKMHGLLGVLGVEAPVLDAASPQLGAVLLEAWEHRSRLREAVLAANERARAAVDQARAALAPLYGRVA